MDLVATTLVSDNAVHARYADRPDMGTATLWFEFHVPLADLDLRLARDFARALSRASADQVPELRASQREWRAQMLKCARNGDPRGCVLEAYTKRIAQF